MSAETELLGDHIRRRLSASAVDDVHVDVDPDGTIRAGFATPRWCMTLRAMLTARVAATIATSEYARLDRIGDPTGRGDGRLQSMVTAVPPDRRARGRGDEFAVVCTNCDVEYTLSSGTIVACPACGIVAWERP